ncbi:hypothetical protein JWS13_20890 [Rhodococcus pseudokoreensis]|uniref:Uncharacterized protein n=1 Tax=Rhodococcus pseudokoreensis TaxID=2811421 RepID=A0A974ZUH5_9NOCA|nr:hypothetical protein [Rhodococcus pseudokoreensis]QSE90910.1 hypothetical protein JWS13_20890 [Rhodococcus pseudokoreensis]
MLEPNGPLPPEIYWRRRALAIGGAVVVLLLVVWLINSLRGGGDSETDPAAASSSLTTPVSISPTASGSSTSSGGSGGSGGGGGAAAAGGEASSGTSGSSGASSSGASSSAAPSGQPVAAGQCPDQSLAIKVAADKPTYLPGEEPSFTTVVTNIGTTPCERDLGSSLQQVLVYTIDGAVRLWSNIDCFPQSAADVRTLAAGEQAQFTVKWSAKTSAPDCLTQPEPQRDPVGPGAYTVVGQLGQLRSAPEPFNLS